MMLVRIMVAAAIVVVAILATRWAQSRRSSDPPTQRRYDPPAQLDRNDFGSIGHRWLIAIFTSDTCSSCDAVVEKARVLASEDVAIEVVPYQAQADLHRRYDIDAVPMTLIADADGVVVRGFVGPVGASDLWSAVADARGD